MSKYQDLRISSINPEIRTELKKLAKSKGKTMSEFLRPKLREIIEEEKRQTINQDCSTGYPQ